MLGIYLSGTGNTKHCVEKFVHLLDENAKVIPLVNKSLNYSSSSHCIVCYHSFQSMCGLS